MAKEFVIGVKIGGALDGTFNTMFGNARKTMAGLGGAADEVKKKHVALGEAMAKAMTHPQRNLGELNRQYQMLGRTLDELKTKQERLGAAMARGAALKQERGALLGEARSTVFGAAAAAAPVIGAAKVAADFQDQLRDIAITGDLIGQEEAKLGQTIRANAIRFNQTTASIGAGLGVLASAGLKSSAQLNAATPVMAEAATATRATMFDLGQVIVAANDNLKIGANKWRDTLQIGYAAAKEGRFEFSDQAKWLPQLAPIFAGMKIYGEKAIAQIGASLTVARMGAGSNDIAANNFKNFLNKIGAPDTIKDFKKAGIDLQKVLTVGARNGQNPVEAMLGSIEKFVTKVGGKEGAAKFNKALSNEDANARAAQIAALGQTFKLGELFQDQEALGFIRVALQQRKRLAEIEATALNAPKQDIIGKDYARRIETTTEQFKQFRIGMTEIGLTIGSTLLPALNQGIGAVMPFVRQFGAWAEANPEVVRGVVALGAGLVGAKLGLIGLKLAVNLVKTPFAALGTVIQTVSAKWTLLRAMWQIGRFAPIANMFGRVGAAAARLGPILSGALSVGFRVAGQAIGIFARALFLNPIGLAVTAIGAAAYLVYRNWGTVKSTLTAGWNWLKGLGNAFRQAGADLIQGLINGIMSKIGAAKAKILEVGAAIKSTFTGPKGIDSHSPSRVFIGYGHNIVEGTRIGILGSQMRAVKAANDLAQATVAAGRPRLADRIAAVSAAGGLAGPGGYQMVNHFSFTINVNGAGNAGSIEAQVRSAFADSFREFERNMRRFNQDKDRRTIS
jgi:TP901 family phage tail tape measure protein